MVNKPDKERNCTGERKVDADLNSGNMEGTEMRLEEKHMENNMRFLNSSWKRDSWVPGEAVNRQGDGRRGG